MLHTTVARVTQPPKLLDRLRRSRFAHGLRCPRCGSTRVRRWGWFSGRQRYRCVECRRTFSDLTSTPAAYVKKLERLAAYSDCLSEGLSVRRAAARVGVHPTTAFRWRHALLAGLYFSEPDRLAGWIEFDWVLFPFSRKGQRKLSRPPRRRGIPHGSRTHHRQVSVWVACDRRGRAISGMEVAHRPPVNSVAADLAGHVQTAPTFIARHGPLGPASAVAHRMGGRFFDLIRDAHASDAILGGVETAASFLHRLRDWMRRFRGVATRYLENYLRWHLFWDRAYRLTLGAALLEWYDPIGHQANSSPANLNDSSSGSARTTSET